MWDSVKSVIDRMGLTGEWPAIRCSLERYAHEVHRWSRVLNLTGSLTVTEIVEVHIADSVLAAGAIEAGCGPAVMDMGSGAGFPGIPVAICLPDSVVYLVESRQKRAVFLERCSRELGLGNVRVIRERLETLGIDLRWRGVIGTCLSRGLAPLRDVMRLAWPVVSNGGRLIVHVGSAVGSEVEVRGKGHGWAFERIDVLPRKDGDRRVALYTARKEVEEDPARSKKN